MDEIPHSKQTVLKIMPRKAVRRRKGWTPERKLYVIHFEDPLVIYRRPYFAPYGGPYHYVGITYNTTKRFQAHLGGYGAEKTARAYRSHISMIPMEIPDMEGNPTNELHVTKLVLQYCRICRTLSN